MFIKIPDFDVNILNPEKNDYEFLYNNNQIENIVDYLDWFRSDYTICNDVIDLLNAAANFNYATNTQKTFVELRNATKTPEEMLRPLEDMANAILQAQKKLKTLSQSSTDYKLLSSAITFVTESIRRQIHLLKTTNDVIYSQYWPRSKLHSLIV